MAFQTRQLNIGALVVGLLANASCGTTWELDYQQCENAVLSNISAEPAYVSSNEYVVISADIYALCPSQSVYVQFSDYTNISTLLGYDASVQGIVLDCTTDNQLNYTCVSGNISTASFAEGLVDYTVFAVQSNSNDDANNGANPTFSMSNYFHVILARGDSK